jgi:hypothetical protein
MKQLKDVGKTSKQKLMMETELNSMLWKATLPYSVQNLVKLKETTQCNQYAT